MVVYFAYDFSWNFIRSFEGFSDEEVFAKVLAYGLENCYLVKQKG